MNSCRKRSPAAPANLLTRNVAKRPLRGCQACISPTIIPDERRIAFHFVPQKTELVARATDEQAALAEVIARTAMPRHLQKRLIVLHTT